MSTTSPSTTGSVNIHRVPATSIDHENMGTRSSHRPGVRNETTVVATHRVATVSETSTRARPAKLRSTALNRLPAGPPSTA